MKSTLPNDLLKSKSQAASHHTTQQQKTAPQNFSDSRPEAILQKKMQEAANASTQVAQLQALQAMADKHTLQASSGAVVQRIKGEDEDEITNTYSEVKIDNEKNYTTRVDGLKKTEKTLVEGVVKGKMVRTSDEVGYQVLHLEENEQKEDWIIMDSVLEWHDDTLCTRNNFSLPVSCIESSEHVIHHYKKDKNQIPNYDPKNKTKNVGLYFGEIDEENTKDKKRKRGTIKNQWVAELDSDDLNVLHKGWTDYDFENNSTKVGEGLFVQNIKTRWLSHAVAVVGKKGSKLIVLERNAGKTTGDNMYLDKNWLVNVYDDEGAFKKSLGKNKDWRIGKLKAL
jgi:hypothetical protein